MDYAALAKTIVDNVGGPNNIIHLEHCATRLRFQLADHEKAKVDVLKSTPGVIGVIDAAQFQIIVGNNVIEVYEAITKNYDLGGEHLSGERANGEVASDAPSASQPKTRSIGSKILECLVGIFQPLVPAIAGAGVLKALLLLLEMFGILSDTDAVYTMFVAVSDATFYFLPIMVAVTSATVFKCNKLVAVAAVGYLLLPATTEALAEGRFAIGGYAAPNIPYNSQVFPPILCVWLLSALEHWLNKVSPKCIRVFFVPMVALAVTIPVTLFVLGPLGFYVGALLTAVLVAIYNAIGWLAVALLAAVLPFMVSTGMHKAVGAYALGSLTTVGYDPLYMGASLSHNMSECGACFAIALRTKSETLRQTAISAGVSALMGITEPALYGITLQHKRAMRGVVISSAISGAVVGILGVKAFVAVSPGLASMAAFVDPDSTFNFAFAFIGFAVAIVASFLIMFFTWKDDVPEGTGTDGVAAAGTVAAATAGGSSAADAAASRVPALAGPEHLTTPVSGDVKSITSVADEVFSSKALGDGIAIVPHEGTVYAPVDATVSMVFETHHAIGLTTAAGAEILIHVGLDTVKLEGDGFASRVSTGDRVHAGDELIRFDIRKIEAAGFDPTLCVIVSNGLDFEVTDKAPAGPIAVGDPLFTVRNVQSMQNVQNVQKRA